MKQLLRRWQIIVLMLRIDELLVILLVSQCLSKTLVLSICPKTCKTMKLLNRIIIIFKVMISGRNWKKNLYTDQIQRIKDTANSSTEPMVQAGAIDALEEYGKQAIDAISDVVKSPIIDIQVRTHG